MPVNAGPEYQKAQEAYSSARTSQEKIKALELMLRTAPKHKSSEKLLKALRERIAKHREKSERERLRKKGGTTAFSVKKEGAAQIVLIGPTNTGKSTLLHELTGAHVEIASYEFTTKVPELGIMDYQGVKLQVIEIPAVVKHFADTKHGAALLHLIQHADIVVYLFRTAQEKALLDREIDDVQGQKMVYGAQENFKDILWQRTGLIKVHTKQPGKERDYPPVALQKGASLKDVVQTVHQDFIQRFRFARVFGKSAKFPGQRVGLNHRLEDDDVVEFHLN